jgi:GNAT superfamily N-acetyltransferase
MLLFYYIKSIFCPRLKYLKLNDFTEIRKIDVSIKLEYFTKTNKSIGYIKYKPTGQIGLFFIDEEYQNRGLGKQILSKVIDELSDIGCNEVWAVTTKNHIFWSNVYDKQFKPRQPAHSSVTGSGYYINLDKFVYNL